MTNHRIPYAMTPRNLLMARALVALTDKHPYDWHDLPTGQAAKVMVESSNGQLNISEAKSAFIEMVGQAGLVPIE